MGNHTRVYHVVMVCRGINYWHTILLVYFMQIRTYYASGIYHYIMYILLFVSSKKKNSSLSTHSYLSQNNRNYKNKI